MAYKNDDFDGILGVRGAWNRNKNTIPEPVWNTFLWYWLDENKPTLSLCYRSTKEWAKEFHPELLEQIPSEPTFRRRIDKDVSVPIKTLFRDGEKAFNDRCLPYIVRLYDKLQANDCWIADNHTFDIQSYDDENKLHRLYLTAFFTVKNQFSKLWNGFCGGTIFERPESLKRRIKDGKLPCDYEIRDKFAEWIDGEYNLQEYGGSEQKFKGKRRIDVLNDTNPGTRDAPEWAINLMLMRSTRKQKISRNGVYVTICGEKIWFYNLKEATNHFGEEVYVRYYPVYLLTVRIYDAKTDKYMFTWGVADGLLADYLEENIERISDTNARVRETKRFVREQAKGIDAAISKKQKCKLLDIGHRKAQTEKDENFRIVQPKTVNPVMLNEEPEPMAVGAENLDIINPQRMLKNMKARRNK